MVKSLICGYNYNYLQALSLLTRAAGHQYMGFLFMRSHFNLLLLSLFFALSAPLAAKNTAPVIKLYPEIKRADNLKALNGISLASLKNFMEYPTVLPRDADKNAPAIVAGEGNAYFFNPGERVYAAGIEKPGTYLIYRSRGAVVDPDSGKVLGKEIVYIGEAKTLSPKNSDKIIARDAHAKKNLPPDERYADAKIFGVKAPDFMKIPTTVATPLLLTKVTGEIAKGDKLRYLPPEQDDSRLNFAPHPAPPHLTARVIRFYDGMKGQEGGRYQTILLNKGERDGLTPGAVLTLYQKINDTGWVDSRNTSKITFKHRAYPVRKIGSAMVYHTADDLAYAVVMNVNNAFIKAGDIAAGNNTRDLEDIPDEER